MGKFLLGILTGVAGLAVAAVITNQLDCRNQKIISDRAKPVDENEDDDEVDDDTEAETDDEADVETNEEAEETENESSASSEKIIEANAPFLAEAIRKLKQAGNLL